jgi:hypothetical protein
MSTMDAEMVERDVRARKAVNGGSPPRGHGRAQTDADPESLGRVGGAAVGSAAGAETLSPAKAAEVVDEDIDGLADADDDFEEEEEEDAGEEEDRAKDDDDDETDEMDDGVDDDFEEEDDGEGGEEEERAADDDDSDDYECETPGCGFEGTRREVEAHERTCRRGIDDVL